MVINGKIGKRNNYRIMRGLEVIKDNLKLSNLKKFKDEVSELKKGEECGICFFDFDDYEAGDIIEAYEIKENKKKK